MAHTLIVGMSESGKSTLGKRLAAQYKAAGRAVLVLDPLLYPDWPCDFITRDSAEFLEVVYRSKSCMLIVDEAGRAIGRYDEEMMRLATDSRHWGHCAHFITQRGAQLSPTVRAQCRHLVLFCSPRKDCEALATDFNCDELLECSRLGQGEFLRVSRFGAVSKGALFNGGTQDVSSSRDNRSSPDNRRTALARGGEHSSTQGEEIGRQGSKAEGG